MVPLPKILFLDAICKKVALGLRGYRSSTYISPHFTAQELCFSEYAYNSNIDNIPPMDKLYNLCYLVHYALEPLRVRFSRPILVNSGYRCPLVNKGIGGVSDSYHLYGRAADIRPQHPSLLNELYNLALSIPKAKVIKYPTFIHIQL